MGSSEELQHTQKMSSIDGSLKVNRFQYEVRKSLGEKKAVLGDNSAMGDRDLEVFFEETRKFSQREDWSIYNEDFEDALVRLQTEVEDFRVAARTMAKTPVQAPSQLAYFAADLDSKAQMAADQASDFAGKKEVENAQVTPQDWTSQVTDLDEEFADFCAGKASNAQKTTADNSKKGKTILTIDFGSGVVRSFTRNDAVTKVTTNPITKEQTLTTDLDEVEINSPPSPLKATASFDGVLKSQNFSQITSV